MPSPDDPHPEYHAPPDWWYIGPLVIWGECSECGDPLIRYWDVGEFYCPRCGLVF